MGRYAINLQPEMLNMLREKLEQPDAPRNIELVRGEASQTTLGSKCAEVVSAEPHHCRDSRGRTTVLSSTGMARVRSPEKRSAILQAAVHETAEVGPGAPTAKIARRAGVAAGTLFTYFANKEEFHLPCNFAAPRLENHANLSRPKRAIAHQPRRNRS
jgi:hypothetical protein